MYNKTEILKIINSASSPKDLEKILNEFLWLIDETREESNKCFIHVAGLMKYVKL